MNPMRRMRIWAGRIGLGRKLAIALAIPALASGIATYLALTGAPPFGPHPSAVLSLLNLDLILLLALGAVVAKRLIEVWAERRRGLAGSRLHVRLVVLFSLIAVMPTIIVAVLLLSFLQLRREVLVQRQRAHRNLRIAGRRRSLSARASAGDPRRCLGDGERPQPRCRAARRSTRSICSQVVSAQAALRGLTEAMVFDRAGHMLARSGLSLHAAASSRCPTDALHLADTGDVAIMTNDSDDRVRALVRLNQFGDVYLYVGRFIEPRVLNHMERDPARRRAVRADGRPALRLSDHLRADLHHGGDAVPGRRRSAIGIHFATQLARPDQPR